MTTLKQQTVSGIKWTFFSSIAQRILTMGSTVILARLLMPSDYGLFALAFVMIDGFGIFKSLGFDSALVRRKDDIERACNTAFFLIPAMGLILCAILFLIAPIGAQFLGNPQIANVIRALAVVFVISCFGKVPQTVLYRDMKFKYKSIAEMAAQTTFIVIALILAFHKCGVWSLVIGYILKNLVQISMEWYFSGWKPAFEFDRSIAWDMFHFGKFVLAGSIVWFLYTNLDNIVVGKLLGVAMLGFYALAMNIANFLNEYILGKVGTIMYPAYSKIQKDQEDVKDVMRKALRYISFVVFPYSFALFAFAPDILRIVFGAKWLPATNIVRILAFVGMFKSLGSAMWPVFLARGKSKADFQVSLVQVVLFFALIIPLVIKFKLVGVGIAVLLSACVSFCIGLIRIRKILDISLVSIFDSVKPALFSSLLMLFGVFLFKSINHTTLTVITFVSSGIGALSLYLLATYCINKHILRELKDALIYG